MLLSVTDERAQEEKSPVEACQMSWNHGDRYKGEEAFLYRSLRTECLSMQAPVESELEMTYVLVLMNVECGRRVENSR
jgi:hypothetical protein